MNGREAMEFRRLLRLLRTYTNGEYMRMKHIPLNLHNEAKEAVRDAERLLQEREEEEKRA